MGREPGVPQGDLTLRLGQLALDRGLISAEQLYDALEEQTRGAAAGAPPRTLPQILVDKGYLKEHEVGMLLELPKPPPRSPSPKVTALGKYTILRELGRGGMGLVYEARDNELGRKVALKMLLTSPNADAVEAQPEEDRFLREAKLTAKLPKHPNVVSVYEAGIIDGKRYLAMELIEGESYGKWRKTGSPPLRQQIEILRDVALAVHHAHQQGVVHRDLKPDNILLDGQRRPHVTDFGLAKSVGQNVTLSLTATGMVIGTPAYMSPEQALGLKSADHRTDIYAMGVMLYETLAGKQPFTGETAIEILLKASRNPVPPPSSVLKAGMPGIDKTLEKICLKSLAKRPKDRYGSAESLANDLTGWLKGEEVIVKVAPSTQRRLRSRRSSVWILAGVIGAFVLALGLTMSMASSRRDDPARHAEIERLKRERDQALKSARPEKAADEVWLESVAPLAAEERLRKVIERLRELNPGFDGQESHRVEGNRVSRLSFSTLSVRQLSPLRALPELERLEIVGKVDETTKRAVGMLEDLSPLKGIRLTCLNCANNAVADLAPLAGMPLQDLSLSGNSKIRSLEPLRGMKLERLYGMSTGVSDLGPLSTMPLVLLTIDDTSVRDLSPLKGLPLEELDIAFTKISDVLPLRDLPLKRLNLTRTKITDLSPLEGMQLVTLHLRGSPVKNLSALQTMPLQKLSLDFDDASEIQILRPIRTLETINDRPVAEFWKKMGPPGIEFKKGLVAHWKLNEGSGTTIADCSGNNLSGRLVDGPRWVQGKAGSSLYFDGLNSHVEIPNSAPLDRLRSGSWTVSVWYKPDGLPPGKNAENNAGYRLVGWSWGAISYLPSDEFMPQYRAPGRLLVGFASGEGSHDAGIWHHVVAVVDQDLEVVIPYVNGRTRRRGAISKKEAPDPPACPWRIGINTPGTDTWRWAARGAIDSVRVYDRALSATEIQALFTSESEAHDR